MRKVVLVGTTHDYQIPGKPASAGFGSFVEKLCNQHGIAAIGEELSEEAIRRRGATQTVCQQVAMSCRLFHRCCDPDTPQRKALGVLQENDIRASAWLNRWSPEKIALEIRASHSIRERFWRDQLIDLNRWPALFICGAEHIPHFRGLLEELGFTVLVAADDWEPTSTM